MTLEAMAMAEEAADQHDSVAESRQRQDLSHDNLGGSNLQCSRYWYAFYRWLFSLCFV